MRCNKCRIELPDASVFCPRCGLRVSSRLAGPVDLARPWPITLLAILHFGFALLLGFGTTSGIVVVAGGETSDLPLVALLAAITALQVATGIGLWKLRSWGRVLQIVLSCFGLLLLPLGTIVSVLVLFYMFQPRTSLLFAGRSPRELSAQELEILTAPTSAGVVMAVVALGLIGFMATGIIAAIAVPNFLHALDSARAKRTVMDMKTIGALIEQYAIDHNRYPQAGNLDALRSSLVPRYAAEFPVADGWGRPLIAQSEPRGYQIWSTGKDGEQEKQIGGGAKQGFDADIVLVNGEFMQWPERCQSAVDAPLTAPATPPTATAAPDPAAEEAKRRLQREAMAGVARPGRNPLPKIDRSRRVRTTGTEVQVNQAHRYVGRIVDVFGHDGFRIQATLIGLTEDGIMLDRGVGGAITDHEVKSDEILTLEVHP